MDEALRKQLAEAIPRDQLLELKRRLEEETERRKMADGIPAQNPKRFRAFYAWNPDLVSEWLNQGFLEGYNFLAAVNGIIILENVQIREYEMRQPLPEKGVDPE